MQIKYKHQYTYIYTYKKEGIEHKDDLEENSFTMVALSATDRLCARESWIGCYILQDLGALSHRVVYLISVYAIVLCNFLYNVENPYYLFHASLIKSPCLTSTTFKNKLI